MVGTTFRGLLIGTDLRSSNAKNADFGGAVLTCANLHSSALGGADFRAANLTGANLKSSSGCNTARFDGATFFCGTTMCDGSVRDDDCPDGPPAGTCCADADCGQNETCQDGNCRCGGGPGCGGGQVCVTMLTEGTCATPCGVAAECPGCIACTTVFGGRICRGSITSNACAGSVLCPAGQRCRAEGTCQEAYDPV